MTLDGAITAVILGLTVVALFLMGFSALSAIRRRAPPSDEPEIRWTSGSCSFCDLLATRYVPSIVERRSPLHFLSWIIPLGLVPPRYRRGVRFQPKCSLCDYHCAIAEREIDTFLEREQLVLAEYLRDRSRRVASFCSTELFSLLSSTSSGGGGKRVLELVERGDLPQREEIR